MTFQVNKIIKLRNCGLQCESNNNNRKTVEKRERLGKIAIVKKIEILGKEYGEKIFSDYWNLGQYEIQNAYLDGRLKVVPVKHRYTKVKEDSRRNNIYTVLKDSCKVCVK